MAPQIRRGVVRTDICSLRPVERRADGTIRVDAHLTKCGVFQYMQPDGTIRRELRLPENVFEQASLDSFLGVPVTNDHPPGMITARNAKHYAVGSQLGAIVKDDDHVRSRLSVFDGDTIDSMDAGKTQVSCGYTCDTIETPGVHPLYGPYDAIQTNIRGNHIAIVDRGRAGITAAVRMDGMMVADGYRDESKHPREAGVLPKSKGDRADGMGVASRIDLCKSRSMSLATPTARIEVVVRTDANPDPDDEASRNAAGENDAPQAPKRQPGQFADKGGDQVETLQDPSDDEDEVDMDGDQPFPPPAKKGPPQAAAPDADPDADDDDDQDPDADPDAGDDEGDGDQVHPFRPGDGSMYDEEGNLTEQATRKIAASSFAVPGKMHLPIHDPRAVKNTMKDFGNYPFQASDEKHAAYNRISGKAKQFGINTAGFEKAHAGKLDRVDRKDAMTEEMKALQAKAEKRKEKLVAAKARIDALEGQVASLTKDLETAKTAPRTDAADDKKVQERIDAKIELLDRARATGAKVESKMSDIEIMRATVKHVDGDDVPADKPEPYVLAMFEGALKRAKKDATDTAKGAAALAATRTAIANPSDTRSDAADDTDEEAAKSRLKAASYTMWNARPENK